MKTAKKLENEIEKIKARLSKKNSYENFGDKEMRQLRDKYFYLPVDFEERKRMLELLEGFRNWCISYTGRDD